MVVIVGAIAELERSLITERVRAGLASRQLEGCRLGRPRLQIDREALLRDRAERVSLTQLAKTYGVSRALVSKILREAKGSGHETFPTGAASR